MTEINIPLLRKAVEWVEAQDALPEIDSEWFQGNYVLGPAAKALYLVGREHRSEIQNLHQVAAHCGTVYCVAGYIGQLTDERYKHSDIVGGVHVSAVAERELGLTYGQAQELFHGSNSAAHIRELAERFAGEAL
jgi:hypothetical protein